jgi:hypothetical protein
VACGEERRVFQGDLDADKAYDWLAAGGKDAIYHGKEDRGISNRSCVGDFISSRIVEG